MEQIQFEEPEYTRSAAHIDKHSLLAGLVIKTGLAKDDLGAQKVLLISAVLITGAAILISYTNFSASSANSVPLSSQLITKSSIPESIKNEIPLNVFNSLPEEFYPKDLPQSTIDQLPSDLRQRLGI